MGRGKSDIDIIKLLKLPWYIRLLSWGATFLRKVGLGKVVLTIREKIMLVTVWRIHLDGIHTVRRFCVNDHYLGVLGSEDNPQEPFEDLADGIRDCMAKIAAVLPEEMHCTIKVLEGKTDGGKEISEKRDWSVYTLARSTPCNRPAEFFPCRHLVGMNSTFAAIVGCNDKSNTWLPNTYSCFACNDLMKHGNYECSRKDWKRYFKSTVVFPLRYKKIRDAEHEIMGFLTFDCNSRGVFGNIPDIFDYIGKPVEYNRRLAASAVFHLGGIIADVLASTIYLYEQNLQEN
jgi:hypothetical protein